MDPLLEKTKKKDKKILHVIYFLDGGKTNTFQFPYSIFKLMTILLALLLTWSVSSLLMLSQKNNEISQLSKRLQTSLDAIFQYQTSENSIFEKTYSSKTNSLDSTERQKIPNPHPNIQDLLSSKKLSVLAQKNSFADNCDVIAFCQFCFALQQKVKPISRFTLRENLKSIAFGARGDGDQIFELCRCKYGNFIEKRAHVFGNIKVSSLTINLNDHPDVDEQRRYHPK